MAGPAAGDLAGTTPNPGRSSPDGNRMSTLGDRSLVWGSGESIRRRTALRLAGPGARTQHELWRRRVSIGDALVAARREAGLTITQVSQRTCIRETIVRGIERGDYSACGGDFYARGHIRSIARAVGLDPEELVRDYDATQASPQPITAAEVFQPFTPVKLKERRRPNWSVVLLAGLVAVLGIAGFRFFGSHGTPAPSRPAAATHPDHPGKESATTAPVAHNAPRHVRIELVTTGGDSWAELTLATGQMIFQGIVYPGSPMLWTETHNVMVRLGNPAVVTLYLNGKKQRLHAINPVALNCTRYRCR
jgi:transcriptional regulator with XRE-family HTH domain